MSLKDIQKIAFPSNGDDRGILTSIEGGISIPFEMKRIFYMHHITQDRGGHAHIDTDQVIIAMSGSLKVKVFDGESEDVYILDDCKEGLYTPRLTFCDLYDFSPGAVCLVLANTHYDMSKSLRNKNDYLKFLETKLI